MTESRGCQECPLEYRQCEQPDCRYPHDWLTAGSWKALKGQVAYHCHGTTTEPQETLSVWHVKNPPAEPAWYPVNSPAEGYQKIQSLAYADLLDDTIIANAIGLCVLEDGEMVDWYDDGGNDIDAWAEQTKQRGCVLCKRTIPDDGGIEVCGRCLVERAG